MIVSVRASRFLSVIAVACSLLLAQTGSTYAGTTGGITGTVEDVTSLAGIADASVTVTSPSQSVTTKTDSSGKYVFLSLAPDTYNISVTKTGYEPISVHGVSVFADQVQSVALTLQASLKTIAQVTSRSGISPVKPGVTTDVYSVNPAQARAAAPLGGGGGLDNAYSAIASMPGAFVPPGQMGVNQTVYIRGGFYDQIGYEYDGVPVNRSFDNYPAHSASSLGQQELEIYTGGGSASANATGLSGFVNQVAKTGTYPGYGNIVSTIGTPTFDHSLTVEAGGASPDRLFSYYLGLGGYNQGFRYFDNANGADLTNLFPNAGELTTGPNNVTTNLTFYPAVYPTCDWSNQNLYDNPAYDNYSISDPGCFASINPAYGNVSLINDRETIANLHFGIPHHKDGGRDDIQLLYQNSAQYRQYYSGVNDAGPNVINALQYAFVNLNITGLRPPHWPDYLTFPNGTAFLAPATTSPVAYLFPGSPTNRCNNVTSQFLSSGTPAVPGACPAGTFSALPNDYRDARWDQASILKAQYQKNIGSRAYVRLFGYSFYSNTNRSGASRRGIGSGFSGTNFDYEVNSHTRGAQLQFADQITGNNQLSLMFNYITSNTYRFNNGNYNNTRNQQISNLTNGTLCYAYTDGTGDNGVDNYSAGDPAPCNDSITQGTFRRPTHSQGVNPCPGDVPAGTPACLAGAMWGLTYTGNQGSVNAVTPKFTHFSVTDEWRPTDRLDINASLRLERDQFDLQNTNTPGKNFWFTAAQKEFCYDPATFQPLLVPQPPQNLSTLNPYVTYTCPGTYVHPDGMNGHVLFSNTYPSTYSQSYAEPRFGMTYTLDPNNVLRFSAGRFAQEPQNYEIQYNSAQENLAAQLIGFLPFGFFTPLHQAQAQFSNNFDASWEHHFRGTDMAFKFTPYYRYATQQLYEFVNVPTVAISPSLNSGTERTSGIELEFTKGDFSANGLSFTVSYTYTNSKEKWDNYANVPINPVDPYNQDIQNYNALTSSCASGVATVALCGNQSITGFAAPCYNGGAPATCTGSDVRNPYYNMPAQPLLDKNAWYDTGLDYPYVSPNTLALVLNYKRDRLSITPAFSLNQGSTYGTPGEFVGIDPRTCSQNQGPAGAGVPTGDPLQADYTSCSSAATSTGSSVGSLFVPNPVSGKFDSFGQYRQPWQFNMGLQVRYDLSPKITANLTIANLVNRCFGGMSAPWTKQYPPDRNVCGYYSNPFYISNFYNGTGPNDTVANGVPLNPLFKSAFVPSYGDVNSYNVPLPLQFYLQLQIKI